MSALATPQIATTTWNIDPAHSVAEFKVKHMILKSEDFLHVEKFPTLTFKSTRISLVRDGELAVEGDLSIRGVTRKVVFSVDGPTPPTKDPWGNTRVAVSATTKINRKDYGLTWNTVLETGGILVGDEVTITLEVEFVKA